MSHTPTPTLELVPFHGDAIVALREGDETYVALRPTCDSIGIEYSAQLKRLRRQPWATVVIRPTVAADGKTRDMAFVNARTFTMWLANVDTFRLKNDQARELLVAYQCEATDTLYRYFHDGGAINPRASEHQVNAIIRQAQMQMELCQAAKGLIHPDHLEARARVVLAKGLGEHATLDEGTRPLYTADYLKGKNLSQKRTKSIAPMFGKRVKAAYMELHGVAPQRYPLNLSNGQTREVYAYTEADRPLMDQVWDEFYATQGVLA